MLLGGESMRVRTFRIELKRWQELKGLADGPGTSRGELLRKAIAFLLKNPEIVEIVAEGEEA